MTENEELELRKQAIQGRNASIAAEFLEAFLTQQRAFVFAMLETTKTGENEERILSLVNYLQAIRKFEDDIKAFIQLGEIAEDGLKTSRN